jgi:excisionase family DNA binding protein
MSADQQHYTVVEIAEILRLGTFRTAELCRDGKIPGAFKPLGQWLIRKSEFDEWLNSKAAS